MPFFVFSFTMQISYRDGEKHFATPPSPPRSHPDTHDPVLDCATVLTIRSFILKNFFYFLYFFFLFLPDIFKKIFTKQYRIKSRIPQESMLGIT